MKTLLIQIRHTAEVALEEYESFLKYSGLDNSEMDRLNVFFDEIPKNKNLLMSYDALFVGGASESSVLEPGKYPFILPLIDLVNMSIECSIPTFASCFGFQIAILALGGEIVNDPVVFEMGTVPISLTEKAANDLVFKGINDKFLAVSVHQQKAVKLPEGCELLAQTDICIHAFKVDDKPFWGFQFHPEVDKRTLVERLGVYQKKYTNNPKHYQQIVNEAKETPESNQLVRNFVDRVLK